MQCFFASVAVDDSEDSDEYFVVAARSAIFRVSLDGTRSHVLVTNTTTAVAIDYNYRCI